MTATRGGPPPPVYMLATLLAMIGLHFVPGNPPFIGPPWRYAGVLLIVAGVVFATWARRLFTKHGTPVRPFTTSTVLVVEGPYRFSRNPMYLGSVLLFLGVGVLLGTAAPLLAIPFYVVLIHGLFIVREERALEMLFGEAYLTYRRRVRRWF